MGLDPGLHGHVHPLYLLEGLHGGLGPLRHLLARGAQGRIGGEGKGHLALVQGEVLDEAQGDHVLFEIRILDPLKGFPDGFLTQRRHGLCSLQNLFIFPTLFIRFQDPAPLSDPGGTPHATIPASSGKRVPAGQAG